MTVVRIKHQIQTILSFNSEPDLSKRKIAKILREVDILSFNKEKGLFIDNDVRIGSFNIRLMLPTENKCKLGSFKKFGIRLYSLEEEEWREIDFSHDDKFKTNSWAKKDIFNFGISDLSDAILYCQRLDSLRIFS